MRILVGWDDSAQADLISLYLGIDGNEVVATAEPDHLLVQACSRDGWDVILLATRCPDIDDAFVLFQKLQKLLPDCPIVGACGVQDVYRMARFLTAGMKSYVLRDDGADFVFLLQATLDNIVAAVNAEREQQVAIHLRDEIEAVRKLQASIIPQDVEAPAGYRIAARYEPSQVQVLGGQPVIMAGGDYYDVFHISPHELVVLVGDASGHGVKACMSIMTMHTLVRMLRESRFRDPAAFVSEINRHLCQQSIVTGQGGFITLLYGVLQLDRQEFHWTSAGHPEPLLQTLCDGRVRKVGDADLTGLPLAIEPDVAYTTQSVQLPPGSRLLLYTDGLVEAFPTDSADHREFGLGGVSRTLEKTSRLSVPETVQALFDASHGFTRGAGRHDDTSLVLIEREAAT